MSIVFRVVVRNSRAYFRKIVYRDIIAEFGFRCYNFSGNCIPVCEFPDVNFSARACPYRKILPCYASSRVPSRTFLEEFAINRHIRSLPPSQIEMPRPGSARGALPCFDDRLLGRISRREYRRELSELLEKLLRIARALACALENVSFEEFAINTFARVPVIPSD